MSAQMALLGNIEHARADELVVPGVDRVSVAVFIRGEGSATLSIHLYDLESAERLIAAAREARDLLDTALARDRWERMSSTEREAIGKEIRAQETLDAMHRK